MLCSPQETVWETQLNTSNTSGLKQPRESHSLKSFTMQPRHIEIALTTQAAVVEFLARVLLCHLRTDLFSKPKHNFFKS